jgi:hypothetical protein
MTPFFKWLLPNAVLLWLLYIGFYFQYEPIIWAMTTFLWITVIAAIISLFFLDKLEDKFTSYFPWKGLLDLIYDLGLIAVLVSYSYTVLAAAYVVVIVFSQLTIYHAKQNLTLET